MFHKIVIIEPVLITEEGKQKLKDYSLEIVSFDTDVNSEEEAIQRIGNADCILVSSRTSLPQRVIESCHHLKHVALCCSFYGKEFCKVDIEALEKRGITYSYLSEHGDNGVVEFTVSQVIDLLHGFHGQKWREDSYDLTNLKVGILGLGNLGLKIARSFQMLGSDVYYYSRTRKEATEKKFGISYLELEDLLSTVDVLSINVNRDVCLIGGDRLKKFGNGKIIINSSLGTCYQLKPLKEWLENDGNYYICDLATISDQSQELLDYKNVICVDSISGDTMQCYLRASEQIVQNIGNAVLK